MFLKDMLHFKTVNDFENYLETIVKPQWLKSLVLHHTWKPVESDWNGKSTMEGMKKYYQRMGWDSGPHIFVCIGSPKAENDGIWIMSDLTEVGIHANECNSISWGLEIVGNYDVKQWSDNLKAFLYDLVPVILKKINVTSVTVESLRGHRECNSPKTCPGKLIDMNIVRDDIQKVMFPNTTVVDRNSPLMSAAQCTLEQAVNYVAKNNGWYTKKELRDIILKSYFDEYKIAGINPCLAIAQMVHETGYLTSWWSNRPRRNPAGIGVTGQASKTEPKPEESNMWAYNPSTQMWHKGLSYSTFDQHAVPAHVARLLAYATTPILRTINQQKYIDQHTKERPLPEKVNGCAPTLAGLEGTWAFPGKGYADKIASHANGIIRMK
jgi:hypothetical protein